MGCAALNCNRQLESSPIIDQYYKTHEDERNPHDLQETWCGLLKL